MNKCEAARPRWKITDPIERNSTVSWKETQEKKSAALNAAKAYVQDGSDYYAELVTAADFFCALYEKTDADN
jgi:hypothetical protein